MKNKELCRTCHLPLARGWGGQPKKLTEKEKQDDVVRRFILVKDEDVGNKGLAKNLIAIDNEVSLTKIKNIVNDYLKSGKIERIDRGHYEITEKFHEEY